MATSENLNTEHAEYMEYEIKHLRCDSGVDIQFQFKTEKTEK